MPLAHRSYNLVKGKICPFLFGRQSIIAIDSLAYIIYLVSSGKLLLSSSLLPANEIIYGLTSLKECICCFAT